MIDPSLASPALMLLAIRCMSGKPERRMVTSGPKEEGKKFRPRTISLGICDCGSATDVELSVENEVTSTEVISGGGVWARAVGTAMSTIAAITPPTNQTRGALRVPR